MVKVIYFTAAAKPTVTEAGHIASLSGYPGIELAVRNAQTINLNGATPEEADYVCNASGSGYPAPYDDTDDYPRITPTTPPHPDLLPTELILRSGVEFLSPEASGTYTNGYTPTIADGAVTALVGS